MSIFNWVFDLFEPATKLVDELYTSDEERGLIDVEKGKIDVKKQEIKAKLAEIEAKVSTRVLDLQQAALEAQTKQSVAEQQHGNWLSKSWRPVASLSMVVILLATGFGFIEYKELLIQISGAFLGMYGIGRSLEKKK